MTIARYPVRDGMVAEMDDVAAVLFGRDGAWGNSVAAVALLEEALAATAAAPEEPTP